jgi:hypothetical protein
MRYPDDEIPHERGPVEFGELTHGGPAKIASIRCKCNNIVTGRGDTEAEALERVNVAWVGHLQTYAPLQPGERLQTGAAQFGGTTKWVGQIESSNPRRGYHNFWQCDHRHDTRDEALACAQAELDSWHLE